MSNGYSGTTRPPLPLISEFSAEEQQLFSRQIVFRHKLHVIKKVTLGDPLRVSDALKKSLPRVEVVPKILDFRDSKGIPIVFHFAGVEYVMAKEDIVKRLVEKKLLNRPPKGTADHYPEEIELEFGDRAIVYRRADKAIEGC